MKLVDDWRAILRKAWSVRFMLLTTVLTGVEIAVQLLASARPTPWFAMMAGLTSVAANISRIISQPRLHEQASPDRPAE